MEGIQEAEIPPYLSPLRVRQHSSAFTKTRGRWMLAGPASARLQADLIISVFHVE